MGDVSGRPLMLRGGMRMLTIEWVGQTLASLCWIVSVFCYGLSSIGDWLQLCAATCWLIANIASAVTDKVEKCHYIQH